MITLVLVFFRLPYSLISILLIFSHLSPLTKHFFIHAFPLHSSFIYIPILLLLLLTSPSSSSFYLHPHSPPPFTYIPILLLLLFTSPSSPFYLHHPPFMSIILLLCPSSSFYFIFPSEPSDWFPSLYICLLFFFYF